MGGEKDDGQKTKDKGWENLFFIELFIGLIPFPPLSSVLCPVSSILIGTVCA